jgi:hypothetical protein
MESLIVEQSMRTMVSNQITLQKLMSSKSRSLKSLLKQRGIAVPKIDNNQQMSEEKSTHDDDDDDDDFVEDDAASAAMMAAALVALQPTATCTK